MRPVLIVVGVAGLLTLGAPHARGQGGGTPDPSDLVPKTVAAGIGQLLTIQGFNLYPADPSDLPIVTLTPLLGGAPNHCVFVFGAPSSSNELYVRLGVFEDPNPPGCSAPVPSVVPPGKYKLTITTAAGTSRAIGLQVKDQPESPIARRLFDCPLTSPCTQDSFFMPGDRMGILAYGTDTVGATAVFIQGTTAIPVDSDLALAIGGGQPDPSNRGLINTFLVPTGLVPGPALVRLRTAVAAIGGGSPDPGQSPLSSALVFTVVAASPPADRN